MMNHALIFAGGTGTRLKNSDIPKQFIEIDNKPIIIHALEYFSDHKDVDDIIIVCLEEWIDQLKKMIADNGIKKVYKIISGGKTGYESIHYGLEELSKDFNENDIVLICDGVRPILSEKLISDCINITSNKGNAIPACKSIDSVMISQDGLNSDYNMSRDNVFITQAPQGYILKDILSAHNKAKEKNIINPISSGDLMAELGIKLHLYEGERNNIKVTTDEDLLIVKAYFEYINNRNE